MSVHRTLTGTATRDNSGLGSNGCHILAQIVYYFSF